MENTNNDKGDGIKIKLGKKATKNGGGFDAIDKGLQVLLPACRPNPNGYVLKIKL